MFTHLALIGLMASGKSAVGEVLAERLGVPLVDVDEAIRARTGRGVRELWLEGGEDAYRPLEREVVVDALSGPSCVLAAPGGIAVDEGAAEAVAQPHVAVIYLHADPRVLAERVRLDTQERPLLGPDPEATLTDQDRGRDAVYRALADRVENVDGRSPEEVAAGILAAFDGFPDAHPGIGSAGTGQT